MAKRKFFSLRNLRRLLLVLVIAVLLYTLIGFFILPPIIRNVGEKQASKALNRKVQIAQVRLNPYALSVTISGLNVKEPDGSADFVRCGEIYVNAQLVSIFKLAPVLREIRLTQPYIHIEREDANRFNFSDLIKSGPPPKEKSKPVLFSLNNIQIIDGRVRVDDKVRASKHELSSIQVVVPSVSNFAHYINADVQPYFAAMLDGSPIELTGRTRPFAESLETRLDFGLHDLDIPTYMADVPVDMNFQIPSGRLTITGFVSYVQYKDRPPALNVSGDLGLADFAVNDLAGEQVLGLPDFRIEKFIIHPLIGRLECSKIIVADPELSVTRDPEKGINLLTLAPAPASAPAQPAENPAENPAETPAEKPAEAPQAEAKPFLFEIGFVELSGGKITFEDTAISRPLDTALSQLNLGLRNVTNAPDHAADFVLSGEFEQGGSFTLSGNVNMQPLSAQMHLDLKQLDISPYQVYEPDTMKLAVGNGLLSISADTAFSMPEKAINATFKGDVTLDNLVTADARTGEEFLKMKALRVKGIDAAFAPLKCSIEEIAFDELETQMIIGANGTPNVAEILGAAPPAADTAPVAAAPVQAAPPPAPPAAPVAVPAQTAAMPDISIQKVTFKGGKVSFTDKSLSPAYSTVLAPIDGEVKDVSPDPQKTADIHISAMIDNTAPVLVTGKLRPAKDAFLADIQFGLTGMDLSPTTPYTDKFIGYPVTEGKLSLGLTYRIEQRKLDSTNSIFLDQFTLGDHVDSPTAIKAPVKLAIALLKDRHGQIKLDFPVNGSLDDPKFRVWPVIVQVFMNLLEKAATSPFSLVASLIGGGEEMSYVEFDYGSAALNAEALKKLDALAKLLEERPALRFELQPQIEPQKDMEVLRKEFMLRKLKIQKLRDEAKQAQPAALLSEVKIAPEEYEKYLTMAYEAEDIPDKPRNFLGATKTEPVKTMEEMLLKHTTVAQDDLRLLAYKRAANIRDYLISKGAVEASRLFIIEPRLAMASAGEAKPRTQFTLSLGGAGAPAPTEKEFAPPPVTAESSDTVAVEPPRSHWFRNVLIGAGGVLIIAVLAGG